MKPSFSIGVLIFNPTDDEYHLERIQKCISSIFDAAREYGEKNVFIYLLLNESYVPHLQLSGVGPKTKNMLLNFQQNSRLSSIKMHLDSINLKKPHMNNKCYIHILNKFILEEKSEYITVFADDYIVPKEWFFIIETEFQTHPNYSFLIPSTTYVPQFNLHVPFTELSTWILQKNSHEQIIGATSGVHQEDIERISSQVQYFRTICFLDGHHDGSFETTVFKRELLYVVGTPYEEYYSLFYNTEFFSKISAAGFIGGISRKCFVFHHGKGGTKAAFKKTGDEKYSNSPVEAFLKNDVDLYNARNNASKTYFWLEAPNGEALSIARPSNKEIILRIYKENIRDILRNFPRTSKTLYNAYYFTKKMLGKK